MELRFNTLARTVTVEEPATESLDTTIIAAIDSLISATPYYVHARTAAVETDNELIQYRIQSADLPAARRVALGAFLYPRIPQLNNNMGFWYTISGRLRMVSGGNLDDIQVLAMFGRLNAQTIVASTTTVENEVAWYNTVPLTIERNGDSLNFHGVEQIQARLDVENDPDTPFFLALQYENWGITANIVVEAVMDFKSNISNEKTFNPA